MQVYDLEGPCYDIDELLNLIGKRLKAQLKGKLITVLLLNKLIKEAKLMYSDLLLTLLKNSDKVN